MVPKFIIDRLQHILDSVAEDETWEIIWDDGFWVDEDDIVPHVDHVCLELLVEPDHVQPLLLDLVGADDWGVEVPVDVLHYVDHVREGFHNIVDVGEDSELDLFRLPPLDQSMELTELTFEAAKVWMGPEFLE